jgi:polyisoprenoid-binding protein YceI
MKALKYFSPFLPLVLLVGCSNPADKVAEASVSSKTNAAAETTKTPTPGEAQTHTYVFGPENSSIGFVGSKVTGKHNGGFKQFTGELHVANGKLADSGNKVVIETASIWADNDRLTGHLKSDAFFDVAKMPTATFETTAIAQQQTNSTVTGNLTLHGVTKQISFPANIQVSDESVELGAEFFINRFDFNIVYPGKANDLIRKEVVLKLKVKAGPTDKKA